VAGLAPFLRPKKWAGIKNLPISTDDGVHYWESLILLCSMVSDACI